MTDASFERKGSALIVFMNINQKQSHIYVGDDWNKQDFIFLKLWSMSF